MMISVALPDQAPPPAIVEAAHQVPTRSTHQVTTPDGVQIAFDLYQRPGRDTLLVICPGFFQSKNTPTMRQLAATLAQHYDVLCMDFRGHGDSGGRFTFSAKEDADLTAVFTWARPRYAHIVLMGFSLGAATAIDVIGEGTEVQALIAVSAPTAFEDIELKVWTLKAIVAGLKAFEPGVGFRPGNPWLTKPRPIDRIRQAKVPILLIHGTDDETTFVHHSQELFAQAEGPKQLTLIEGGRHAEELYRQDPEGFLTLVEDWLTTVPSR